MAIWAVTGGIACGKSAVMSAFKALGVHCYSADEDARDVLREPTVEQAVREAFPDAINAAGSLDRERLGQIIYSDSSRREVLGKIMHPAIRRRMAERIQQNRSASPSILELYEVPLLFEGGLETWFDGTICVTCDEDVQIQRLIDRHQIRYGSKLSGEEVLHILKSQLAVTEKAARADIVIDNSRTSKELKTCVENIFYMLKTRVMP